eukprot:gene11273-8546_t
MARHGRGGAAASGGGGGRSAFVPAGGGKRAMKPAAMMKRLARAMKARAMMKAAASMNTSDTHDGGTVSSASDDSDDDGMLEDEPGAKTGSTCAGAESPSFAVIDIEDGTEINGEAVSPSEKKDLNRARAYLRESAERHGVPCYSTIDGACAAVCKMFELDNAAAGGVQTQATSSQQQQQQYEAIDAAAIDSRRIRRTTTEAVWRSGSLVLALGTRHVQVTRLQNFKR